MVSAMTLFMWTKEEKTLEEAIIIGINPDFEKDGKLLTACRMNLGFCGLVIGSTREARKVNIPEVHDIVDKLSGHMDGALIGDTSYVAFFYKCTIFTVEGAAYMKGSMLVLKVTSYGIELLNDEEYEEARKEMESRKAVLEIGGEEYTVFKLS